MAHGDPSFARAGQKILEIFRTTGFQLKLLVLIEFPNILHCQPVKKNQIGCGLGAKFGPNYVQCCEKRKRNRQYH